MNKQDFYLKQVNTSKFNRILCSQIPVIPYGLDPLWNLAG
jgi:hypothetical protein